MKSEVYSWRVSTDLKMDLEYEARRRKMSVAAVLDLAAREWLKKHADREDEKEQKRIIRRAMKAVGTIELEGGPFTNEKVRQIIRERLMKRYGG